MKRMIHCIKGVLLVDTCPEIGGGSKGMVLGWGPPLKRYIGCACNSPQRANSAHAEDRCKCANCIAFG